MTENELVGQPHQLNGHESEQTLGDSDGQGNLACAVHAVAKSWTQLSDWNNYNFIVIIITTITIIPAVIKYKFYSMSLMGFPGGSGSKESSCNAGDLGSIPGSRRSPWRREW